MTTNEISSNSLSECCQLFHVYWKLELCFSFEIYGSDHVKDQTHKEHGYGHAINCITIQVQTTDTKIMDKTELKTNIHNLNQQMKNTIFNTHKKHIFSWHNKYWINKELYGKGRLRYCCIHENESHHKRQTTLTEITCIYLKSDLQILKHKGEVCT